MLREIRPVPPRAGNREPAIGSRHGRPSVLRQAAASRCILAWQKEAFWGLLLRSHSHFSGLHPYDLCMSQRPTS